MRDKRDFDAVVVGSGPNGFAAAILMQQNGLDVLVVEGKSTIGGGLRSASLTLPGYLHDVCSAVHPLAVASPFFETLPLNKYGLEYIFPPVAAAHPFDNGKAALLKTSVNDTAVLLGEDERSYKKLMEPVVKNWPLIAPDVLGPLHFPKHPIAMAQFGLPALSSVSQLVKRFKTEEAKGLFGGMSAHSIQPLTNMATSAVALVLMAAGHLKGWPVPKGGSVSIANALQAHFLSLGGKIETDFYVRSMKQLPSAHAILFDITPKQLLQIAGHSFSAIYRWQLKRYRYGMGVFKVDWALDAPIPFKAPGCNDAGTLHLGNTFAEIAAGERQSSKGQIAEKPFVLLAQPSLFDPSRAPGGKHTAWAYCHVP